MSEIRRRPSPEDRERAMCLARETREEHPSEQATIRAIMEKFGCTAETLRTWVRQAERDGGSRAAPATMDRQESLSLINCERENRGPGRANGRMRKTSAFFAAAALDCRLQSQIQVSFTGEDRRVCGIEPMCPVHPIAPSNSQSAPSPRAGP